MFSGIVETSTPILTFTPRNDVMQLELARPPFFDDLSIGDSICVNGVCLTIEQFDSSRMRFALAGETLQITQWARTLAPGHVVNVERSLRLGDRIHGHLVTGHVEGLGEVTLKTAHHESIELEVRIPFALRPLVWKKGSLAIQGVSLTVNEINDDVVRVWLIPETLKRTNLSALQVGNVVNLEPDFMARAILRQKELGYEFN